MKIILLMAFFIAPIISVGQIKTGSKAYGGIVVYEKDGHGLVVLDKDLGKYKLNDAIKAVDELVVNGFDDWRLPTSEEMESIYKNLYKNGIGSFKLAFYWIKKGINYSETGDFSFIDGTVSSRLVRGNPPRVMPIRTF